MAAFSVRDLSFTYPQEGAPALKNISLDIPEGGITLICGASGSGKSTLLRRLKTCLADHGEQSGEVLFFGRCLDDIPNTEQARRIGFVFQHPDDQIVTDRVFHEMAFGPESLGWKQDEMRLAVAEMASFFGISELFMKNVSELSGGQKQLLNLASAAVMHPDVLILDEPTSQLDPIAASDFLSALRKLNDELGLTVILTEHRLEEALPMADMLAVMERGRLIAFDEPQKAVMQIKSSPIFESMPTAAKVFAALGGNGEAPLTVREGRAFVSSLAHGREAAGPSLKPVSGDPSVTLRECWFRYEKNSDDILRGLSFELHRGEVFSLVGGNGSGKSTSVGVISGRLKPYRGKVISYGARIAALPQDPRELLARSTVREELEEMNAAPEAAESVIELLELGDILDRHPFDISGGEQQRAALGKVLLTEPDVLLLDEPTKGFDGAMKKRMGGMISQLKAHGKSILIVSHDIEFAAEYSDRCALLFRGEIITQSAPREFFSGNYFYTTAAAKLSRGIIPGAVLCREVIECLRRSPDGA